MYPRLATALTTLRQTIRSPWAIRVGPGDPGMVREASGKDRQAAKIGSPAVTVRPGQTDNPTRSVRVRQVRIKSAHGTCSLQCGAFRYATRKVRRIKP